MRSEALDLVDGLVAQAADHPEPVECWVRAVLHDARQTNAGQRLTRPADLAAWLGTALALRPGVAMRAECKAGRIAVSLSGKGVDYALLEEIRAALRRLGRG